MEKKFTTRTALIIGEENINKLEQSNILVIGIGGVGSFATEALVRAGIGNITIVDYAEVNITDINRQLPGLNSNLGKDKVEVVKNRLLDINPNLNIRAIKSKFNQESCESILDQSYDYVIDAIDMVSSKILLVEECVKRNINIISSMGMGNKLDPTKLEISDLSKTHTCPLAKVMRKELRDRGIEHITVVFSTEQPIEVKEKVSDGHRILPGSISFMSSSGGLIIASKVIRDLLKK